MSKIFFVGIGGAGMSRLAMLYNSLGYEVEGSDIRDSEYLSSLSARGIKIHLGHSEKHIDKNVSLVVYSSAIKETNPELVAAKKLKIKILKRGEALASVVNKFKNIVISGTHGKTTTTSVIGHILKEHGIRANVYVGGKDEEFNDFYPDPDYFVVESDESDGSFLYLAPDYLVITNIDRDHLNHYNGNFDELKKAFRSLLEKSEKAVVCSENKNAAEVAEGYAEKVLFYGGNGLTAKNVKYTNSGTEFDVFSDGKKVVRAFSPLYGDKNVLNVLAALLIAKEVGIPFGISVQYLKSFAPPSRRMEIKAREPFLLIDDHADHPTEIKATLSALRKHFPNRRLIAVFQPHRYSRMKLLGRSVANPFKLADIIIVTEIFSAFEEPINDINGKNIAGFVKEKYPDKEVYFSSGKNDVLKTLNSILKKDDMVVLLGPGDVGELSEFIILKGDI